MEKIQFLNKKVLVVALGVGLIFLVSFIYLNFYSSPGYKNLGFGVFHVVPASCGLNPLCFGNSVAWVKSANPLFFRQVYTPEGEMTPIGKDNRIVYFVDTFRYVSTFDHVDAKTFTALSGTYYKDAKNVYYADFSGPYLGPYSLTGSYIGFKGIDFSGENKGLNIIEGADAETFQIFNPRRTSGSFVVGHIQSGEFARDKRRVYYVANDNYNDKLRVLESADPLTFEIIDMPCNQSSSFARDKERVYLGNTLIPLLQPQTFRVVKDSAGKCSNYAKDDKYVYHFRKNDYEEYEITRIDADAPTFGSFEDPLYFNDKNHVYRSDWIEPYHFELPGAKPEDFYLFPDGLLARSQSNIYCRGELLEGADAETFKVIMTEVDYVRRTFNVGPSSYSRDKNNVYYQCYALEGADPKTFVLTGGGSGEDRYNYYSGKVIRSK